MSTSGAFQPALAAGVCDVLGTPCGDAFIARITAGGPGVVPPVSLTVTPGTVPPGGTVTATWAGIPLPTAEDHLRLYALGSPDSDPSDMLSWWPTTGTAAGNLLLALPGGLVAGWYELRLYSPDPDFYGLAQVIARTEPFRVDGTAQPPTALCEGAAGSGCDDGDPCTVDDCVPGRGCVSTPTSGFASVTCTCRRVEPAVCAGLVLPPSIRGRQDRACGLFDDAAGTTDGALGLRRLRKAARTLKGSIRTVSRARKRGISRDCAAALMGELRDAKERAERLLTTLRSRR